MHDDEVAVRDELARALIDAQLPDYVGLALRRLSSAGTVNVTFRLGASLSAGSHDEQARRTRPAPRSNAKPTAPLSSPTGRRSTPPGR